MSRLGTYTTYDAPATERDAEALQWLKDKFEPLDAFVFEKLNPHDFGSYPSFEVDYPQAVERAKEVIDTYDLYLDDHDQPEDMPSETEAEQAQEVADKFHSQADDITENYSRIFFS
jgi:hypothetical protein